MNINLIYDLTQYNSVLDGIKQEFNKRNIIPYESHTYPIRGTSIDMSLAIQDVAYRGNRIADEVRFFINHGASATKKWAINFDIDCFISPSQWWEDSLRGMGSEVDIMSNVGWPKNDLLFAHASEEAKKVSKEFIQAFYGLDDRPIIHIFPTYKKSGWGSDTPKWARDFSYAKVYKALSEKYNVFVSPHQMDNTSEFNDIPRHKMLTGFNIQRVLAMAGADVIITDTSGICYEAAGMDCNVILLGDNHRLQGDGEEVDIGPRVTSLETIDFLLQDLEGLKSHYKKRRQYWSDKILGPVDGRCCERIVSGMLDYVQR